LREKIPLERLKGIDCRIILKLVLKNRGWVWTRLIDWGRDKWWAVLNIVMNLQFS